MKFLRATLNPWKRARELRELRGINTSLQDLVKSLQKVISTQNQFIALQQVRIDTLLRATEKQPVTDPGAGQYLN